MTHVCNPLWVGKDKKGRTILILRANSKMTIFYGIEEKNNDVWTYYETGQFLKSEETDRDLVNFSVKRLNIIPSQPFERMVKLCERTALGLFLNGKVKQSLGAFACARKIGSFIMESKVEEPLKVSEKDNTPWGRHVIIKDNEEYYLGPGEGTTLNIDEAVYYSLEEANEMANFAREEFRRTLTLIEIP